MSQRKPLLNTSFIEEINLKNIEPKTSYKKSSNITISFESENQDTSQIIYSDSEYPIENEENEKSNGFSIDIVEEEKEKKMNSKRISKRRRFKSQKNASNYFINIKKEKNFLNNKRKNSSLDKKDNKNNELFKKNEELNRNTAVELDDCYRKLETIISNHSYTEIIHILLKIMNDINEENNILFNDIKKATSKIKNKESILLMFVGIVLSQIPLNKNKNKKKEKVYNGMKKMDKPYDIITLDDNSENSFENAQNYIDDLKKKTNIKKITKKIIYINEFKKLNKSIYNCELGKHYKKQKDEIFCFYPKSKNLNMKRICLYCTRRDKGCEGKIVVYKDSNKFISKGEHNHKCGLTKQKFYKEYPFLLNENWNNIQIIRENEADKMVRLD